MAYCSSPLTPRVSVRVRRCSCTAGRDRRASEMTRVAVVTGGGSGLGQTISEHLAREGHRVAVLDVDAEAAEKVSADLAAGGASAVAIQVDVADPVRVAGAFETVRDTLGPIEILITSAAVAGFTRFDQIGFDEWNRYLAVNLTGTFLCLQAALPDMVAPEWGLVVTTSQAGGQTDSRRQGNFGTPIGGVIALTKTVALEYASKGIT